MVLQLLMHLINRIDRSLFQSRATSESGCQIAPVNTPTGHVYPLQLGETEENGSEQGFPGVARAIIQAIPDKHTQLRHTIQDLQIRIERSEFL